CGPLAECVPGVGCQCRPGFQGNGSSCVPELRECSSVGGAPDLCSEYNGGCHQNADCNQTALTVNCTCHFGYQGDGFFCEPINRCVEEANGGCSDFASCKFVGPNKRDCECLPGYVGNGVQCLEKLVPPVDRCLEDNGGCDPVATCKDLHYHAKTAGVFHLQSPSGKYMMNFSQADAACKKEGATLATFKQLGDAQQLLLDYSGSSEGKELVDVLSHRTADVTLFVPHNAGFAQNQTIRLVNKRLVLDWDIPASNGIIHVLGAPLTAPPPTVSQIKG
ncbi:unnamed protein product, partial [Tetraodon nigroviridis]